MSACILLALTLGSAAMVYPFLLMISGSTKSGVDQKDLAVVPRFLVNDAALYRKHVEGLFNESLHAMNTAYDGNAPSFEVVEPPVNPNRHMVGEWFRFLTSGNIPPYAFACGYTETPVSMTLPKTLRDFRARLAARHGGRIEQVNRALGADYANWPAFYLGQENYLHSTMMPADTALAREWWTYKAGEPAGNRVYFSVEGFFKSRFLAAQYTKDIGKYNHLHGTRHSSYSQAHLSRTCPAEGPERSDWEQFTRFTLNPLWVRADKAALPLYRAYLKARYTTIEALNHVYGAAHADFERIPLVEEAPFSGVLLSDWVAFLRGWKDPDTGALHRAPADMLRIHSVDFMFRDFLENRFGSIASLNEETGASFGGFMDVLPPQRDAHYLDFLGHKADLRAEFALRNFRAVIDYMILHGRGVANTAVYCALTVLFALIVNPLAAYALSRHKLPPAYRILFFLMLPMAFPSIVTQIPMFLILKKLNLLNTFAALILPGLAHGYSIFLLKGFFDSLPRELYESASLDGAGEWTMFWTITMNLSKPVLAVIALQAFALAYGNFMFALLICQDEKMWTLMVWLYELQQKSGQGVVYASLLIAAIPTLTVFVLCQRIIMRGIVIPCER